MTCPHLLNWTVSSCIAADKPYVPSIFELKEYCTDKRHERCPLYPGFAQEGRGSLSWAGVIEKRDPDGEEITFY